MYDIIKERFSAIIEERNLGSEEVRVIAKTLTPEEAIGNPEDDDYPIQKGKERLVQAEFKGSQGQAFTDMFGNYEGKISQIIEMDLSNNFRRAIFISTVNSVMRHLGMVDKTVHCKDKGPNFFRPVFSESKSVTLTSNSLEIASSILGCRPTRATLGLLNFSCM